MKGKATISVLGLGNWGTALANHLAKKGHAVLGWSIEQEIVSGINSNGKNPRFLSDVQLSSNLRATENFSEALDADLLVLVFPSSALAEILPRITLQPGAILVSAIKGIDRETFLTPLQLAAKHLGSATKMAVLSGPSFARDVADGRPCGVVAASAEESTAARVAEIFSSNEMKVYISVDPLGVELGGTLKNVVALAAGIGDGLSLGESARAGLITRGLAEMTRLVDALGGDVRTMYGLAGLGDLAMTATSTISRNHQVGLRLGRGEMLQEILSSLGSVAEGVTTSPILIKLAKHHQVEMPITQAVVDVLVGKSSPTEAVQSLLSRPVKGEF